MDTAGWMAKMILLDLTNDKGILGGRILGLARVVPVLNLHL